MKELVDMSAQVVPLLKITRDDINNKVMNSKGVRERGEVSQVILYHVIRDPSLSKKPL